jgi:SAM-dependent methyltransferase
MSTNDEAPIWTEQDSEQYHRLSNVIAPNRDEQLATLLSLLPFSRDETFRAADLGCGEGPFLFAVLEHFRNATGLGLDISEDMRATTLHNLQSLGDRVKVAHFELASPDWYELIDGFDCIVSGLCIHHLTGALKQKMYREVFRRIAPGGAFLIADLVNPRSPEAQRLYGQHWDHLVHELIASTNAPPSLFDAFDQEHWNYFHYHPPVDHPSPLFDQLQWLRDAGFTDVDAFWLRSGHTIYGGYKRASGAQANEARNREAHTKTDDDFSFEDALQSAKRALDATVRKKR